MNIFLSWVFITTLQGALNTNTEHNQASSMQQAFSQSVQADIWIQQAQQEEARHGIEQARTHYQKACELTKQDTEFCYEWACFEKRQGKLLNALQILDIILNNNQEETLALFDKIAILTELKEFDQAQQILMQYGAQHAYDSRVDYYLGLLAFLKQDLDTAARYFKQAAEHAGPMSSWARAYYAYMAYEKKTQEAEQAIEQALKSPPNEEWKNRLLDMQHSLQPKFITTMQKVQRFLSLQGSLGLELDTNANLAPLVQSGATSLGPQIKPILGLRATAQAMIQVHAYRKRAFSLAFMGTFNDGTHINQRSTLKAFDYGGFETALQIKTGFDKRFSFDFGLDLEFRDLFVNNYQRQFVLSGGASPYFHIRFKKRHFFRLMTPLNYRYFFSINELTQDGTPIPTNIYDRTGFLGSALFVYQFPLWRTDWRILGAYDLDSARGHEYFSNGTRVQATIKWFILDSLSLELMGNLSFRDFPKSLLVRQEIRLEGSAQLAYQCTSFMTLNLSYTYTNNTARNLIGNQRQIYPNFSYVRHMTALSLRAWF